MQPIKRIVVMGVSGCGKSTVGAALAKAMNAQFSDGDDLHPQSNIEKMSRGEPLNDHDRAPWLAQVGTNLGASDHSLIIGCSALKQSYRDIIRKTAGTPVSFALLHGTRNVLLQRMSARKGHFMPVSLLDTQLETLEPLTTDEIGVTVDIDQPLEAIVSTLASQLA